MRALLGQPAPAYTPSMASAPASDILAIVETEGARLRRIPAAETSKKPGPGKWSQREVLGHLVDSALNNHRRFILAQLSDSLEIPGYAQEDWVRCQGYSQSDWAFLIDLWTAVNRHLAHVVEMIPHAKLSVPCRIGDSAPVPLQEVVVDYVRHLRHHLAQI